MFIFIFFTWLLSSKLITSTCLRKKRKSIIDAWIIVFTTITLNLTSSARLQIDCYVLKASSPPPFNWLDFTAGLTLTPLNIFPWIELLQIQRMEGAEKAKRIHRPRIYQRICRIGFLFPIFLYIPSYLWSRLVIIEGNILLLRLSGD